jgi:hypothetical protein
LSTRLCHASTQIGRQFIHNPPPIDFHDTVFLSDDPSNIITRMLTEPINIEDLPRTASDDELDELLKASQFYSSKYSETN